MKKLNKKGFTLVELLAVIVILALLMVVATRTIGTTMTNSRVAALQTEAQKLFSKTYEEAQTLKLLGDINNGTSQSYSYGDFTAAATGVTYGTLEGNDGDYTFKIVIDSNYDVTKICVFDSKQKKGYEVPATAPVTLGNGDIKIDGTTLSFGTSWKNLTACS